MARIRLLVLCVISLLPWVQGQENKVTQIFCDDKDTETAVDLALVALNKKIVHGNKFALYQIVEARKAQNESSAMFSLDFLARESDCPAGGDKVWRDCDYLPSGREEPSPCKAKVHKSNLKENLEVLFVQCYDSVEPPIIAERSHCLGCPEEIDIESEDIKEPLQYSVAQFNAVGNSKYHFLLRQVGSATRQVVSGLKYDLQFDLEKSNCSKSNFIELTDECGPDDQEKEFSHCNSTVYVAPWRHEEPEVHIDCAPGLFPGVFIKRRPPGWSPLRNIHNFEAVIPITPVPPTKPKTKEESSEESKESIVPSLNSTLSDSIQGPALFHCPSKPWKKFVNSTLISLQEAPTSMPFTGLSDFDLLG